MRTSARLAGLPTWAPVLIIVLVTGAIRWGLVDVPLERDEGEFAAGAQLLLDGSGLYQHLHTMKLPGVHAVYAVILSLFGHSVAAIHLGLLLVNGATTVLVFLLAGHLFEAAGRVAAAACFAVLSLSPSVQGSSANAEHFVLVPAVGGLLLVLQTVAQPRRRYAFVGGLLLGLGILMKQHGAAFVGCAGALLAAQHWLSGWSWSRCRDLCLWLVAGAALPYALICLATLWSGDFGTFWFWTFKYAATYASAKGPMEAWSALVRQVSQVIAAMPLIWALALLGLIACVRQDDMRQRRSFLWLLAASSFVAILPGLHFRPHYFVLTLPVVALLVGLLVSLSARGLERRSMALRAVPMLVLAVCLAASIYSHRSLLFDMTPTEVSRTMYGRNPFVESVHIGRFIGQHTSAQDRIAILGSEPQIAFYADRRSATAYIYMYELMEEHALAPAMQEEMVAQIESAAPAMVVFVSNHLSWIHREGSPKQLLTWFQAYQRHYEVVGLADMLPDGTQYRWGADARRGPESPVWVAVFRRR